MNFINFKYIFTYLIFRSKLIKLIKTIYKINQSISKRLHIYVYLTRFTIKKGSSEKFENLRKIPRNHKKQIKKFTPSSGFSNWTIQRPRFYIEQKYYIFVSS